MPHYNYSFMDMMREIFTGSEAHGGKQNRKKGPDISRRDGYSGEVSSTRTSRDFDPSDSAGEAFRSVFGDDNRE